MERLTIPDEPVEGGMRRAVVDTRAVRGEAMKIYWLLKKYEDTGLTPDQIREIDRLYAEKCKELAAYKRAEEQGTILRVPVARGNILWEIIREGVEGNYIRGIKVQEVSDSRIWANDACFDYDDIGRTVFLLPKEAEDKLAEMEETDENSRSDRADV